MSNQGRIHKLKIIHSKNYYLWSEEIDDLFKEIDRLNLWFTMHGDTVQVALEIASDARIGGADEALLSLKDVI